MRSRCRLTWLYKRRQNDTHFDGPNTGGQRYAHVWRLLCYFCVCARLSLPRKGCPQATYWTAQLSGRQWYLPSLRYCFFVKAAVLGACRERKRSKRDTVSCRKRLEAGFMQRLCPEKVKLFDEVDRLTRAKARRESGRSRPLVLMKASRSRVRASVMPVAGDSRAVDSCMAICLIMI